jgi:putative hemolysin
MAEIGFQVGLLLALVAINGFLALSEMAIVSARRARLQQVAERGDRGAQAALRLAREPSRFLSTIQIGITLIGIVAGAFGGETLSLSLGSALERVPALAPYATHISFVVVVLSITYASLVLGELVPKRLALIHGERVASRIAVPMQRLAIAARPAVWFLTASTNGVLRLLRQRAPEESPVTSEEVKILIEQATEAGGFDPHQQHLIQSALNLERLSAGDLMTPHPLVQWFDLDESPEDILHQIAASSHLAFPLAQGSLDEIVGIISTKRLLGRMIAGDPLDLRAAATAPTYVVEHLPALKLLDAFKTPETEMVVVLAEHGEVKGIVTLTDLLGAITGEALPLGRTGGSRPLAQPDGSWILDGLLGIDQVKEILEVDQVPGEDRERYQSLGGFVLARLGRVPTVGETFAWGRWEFQVVAIEGRRIDKVLVRQQ